MRDKKKKDHIIYTAILYEYIHILLKEHNMLEFFIEGQRSTYGKIQHPKFDLLNIISDAYYERQVDDITIIPISISYDRVLEADSFPYELIGERKVKESFGRVIQTLMQTRKDYGRIFVNFLNPISIKSFTNKYIEKKPYLEPFMKEENRKEIVHSLGYTIIHQVVEKTIIVPTSIVASILLMHRRGISESILASKVEWLAEQIKGRGGKIGGIDDSITFIGVQKAMMHINSLVKRKKDMFDPFIEPKDNFKDLLLLNYYKNMLLHVFFSESLVACVLFSFGQLIAFKEGVELERFHQHFSFLQNLLKDEVITRHKYETKEQTL